MSVLICCDPSSSDASSEHSPAGINTSPGTSSTCLYADEEPNSSRIGWFDVGCELFVDTPRSRSTKPVPERWLSTRLRFPRRRSPSTNKTLAPLLLNANARFNDTKLLPSCGIPLVTIRTLEYSSSRESTKEVRTARNASATAGLPRLKTSVLFRAMYGAWRALGLSENLGPVPAIALASGITPSTG